MWTQQSSGKYLWGPLVSEMELRSVNSIFKAAANLLQCPPARTENSASFYKISPETYATLKSCMLIALAES